MKKIVRNLGDRYHLLSGRETVELIDKALKERGGEGLSDWQKTRLFNSFGNSGIWGNLDMPFIAYRWEEKEVSGSFLWRLSYPFFLIYPLIILSVVLPIKWLLTGKYYLSQTSRIAIFNITWLNKITNRYWHRF